MIRPIVVGRLWLLLILASACNRKEQVSACQALADGIAQAASGVMHHSLDASGFDGTLRRAEADTGLRSDIPALEQAQADYKSRMHAAIKLAIEANNAPTRPDLISANATARAEAAKAIYLFLESTNLHCAGER